jgi:ketose-bisphosphate aldolase
MPLVTLNEILPKAKKEGRGIAAFNVANLETLLAIFHAANETKSPVIIQVYQRLFNSAWADMIAAMTIKLAEKTELPIVLHLDHGTSIDQLKQAIKSGYTSVMIDGSQLSFEENIELTRLAVPLARNSRVSIEAEIGHVPFGDGDAAISTVEEAREFYQKTGVDALAVSIGTAHGFYKEEPKLDIQRAKEINESVDIPLVLHGGTGVPCDQLKKVIAHGFAKVNIATEFQNMFLEETRKELEANQGKFKPLDLFFAPCVEKLAAFAAEKIRTLNSQ